MHRFLNRCLTNPLFYTWWRYEKERFLLFVLFNIDSSGLCTQHESVIFSVAYNFVYIKIFSLVLELLSSHPRSVSFEQKENYVYKPLLLAILTHCPSMSTTYLLEQSYSSNKDRLSNAKNSDQDHKNLTSCSKSNVSFLRDKSVRTSFT